MGLFDKVKELSQLNETIENESRDFKQKKYRHQDELRKLKLELLNKKQALHALNKLIEDREETIQNIRENLDQETKAAKDFYLNEAEQAALNLKNKSTLELSELLESISESKNELERLDKEKIFLKEEVDEYLTQARRFKGDIVGLTRFKEKFETTDFHSLEEQIEHAAFFMRLDGALDTIIKLPLHANQSKELKNLANLTRQEINHTVEHYKVNYTNLNQLTLYRLMIIGLQAELQLILYNLTELTLNETKGKIKEVFRKYQIITGENNQRLVPILTRFTAELEPLYLELVEIEYKYYLKLKQEKAENKFLKKQIQEEAAEQKAIDLERKALDRDEARYLLEMDRIKERREHEHDSEKLAKLEENLRLNGRQLNLILQKREELRILSRGQAGYVYVISNVGSFGENIFKIGVTRSLDPRQYIEQLENDSLPFGFDIHAIIFSENAVKLERALHERLKNQRVNQINSQKNFFHATIEEMEDLVNAIDPTTFFTRTMFAEDFKQSISILENQNLK